MKLIIIEHVWWIDIYLAKLRLVCPTYWLKFETYSNEMVNVYINIILANNHYIGT